MKLQKGLLIQGFNSDYTVDDEQFPNDGTSVWNALKGRHDLIFRRTIEVSEGEVTVETLVPFHAVYGAMVLTKAQPTTPPTDAICGSDCSSNVVGVGEADCMKV